MHQQIAIAPEIHDAQKNADRLFRRLVAQNAVGGSDFLRLLHRSAAHPASKHVALRILGHFAQCRRHLGAMHERRRRTDGQHRIGIRVGQYRLQRSGPVRGRDVGRKHQRVFQRSVCSQQRLEARCGVVRERRQLPAAALQRMGGDMSKTESVAKNAKMAAAHRARPRMRERLDGFKQIFQGVDTNPAGAPQRGFVDIAAAKRRTRRARVVDRPAANRHHRLVARGSPCRRHELAPIRHRVELHQDRLGSGIAGQPVEHIGQIDVEADSQMPTVEKPIPLL